MSNESNASQVNKTQWVVENSKSIHKNASELVMAWARDIQTGEAKYIGELGHDRRGASCKCECFSCKADLVAVNAAKNDFIKRPHFRHPAGTERDSCSVLTARAAALKMFTELGLIELPRYRKNVSLTGFSGKTYDASISIPSEKVAIRSFHLRDSVTAELTLEGGRKLRVVLIGEFDAHVSDLNSQNETNNPITTIRICVDSPEVAGMNPAELKKKLVIIVQQGQWCDYWNESQLAAQARKLAEVEASNHMDWSDEVELLQLLPSTASELLKRETLLHIKAKQILAKSKLIKVPGTVIEASADLPDDKILNRQQTLSPCDIHIESAEIEKSQGDVRPDVLISTLPNVWWPGGQLMIEVTVTNHIDTERLLRIRKKMIPALEIDLSKFGGTVTEEQFTRILLIELQSKRWLSYAFAKDAQYALEKRISDEAEIHWEKHNESKRENEFRKKALTQPISGQLSDYLQAVESYASIREETEKARAEYHLSSNRKFENSPFQPAQEFFNKEEWMQFKAKILSWRGFQHSGSSDLIGRKGCIIERLLSIRENRPIGYQLNSSWQVINAIQQEKDRTSQWHTLYLIAIHIYKPTLSKTQKELVSIWRTNVINSLRKGESKYRRNDIYDSFLAALFPEMADSLKRPLPNKIVAASDRFVETDEAVKKNDLSDDEAAYWYEGKDYETWARMYPKHAKEWEGWVKSSKTR